ncbi:MAG: 50S ribosomal protein L18 [Desulfobacterales bacterium]|nr:50S ribosomal protein L18 [Desulfobacterales bacterium]MDD4070794.1 50S ribosomal protein L18 [Desulfobacterales bacterium]MDD4391196.1 50S ribosomal protein L18 [Desulfobacterales bacterium]
MASTNPKAQARLKRKIRIRKRLLGTQQRPRLSVFRSSKHIYAQIIDDVKGNTLVAASTTEPEIKGQLTQSGKIVDAVAIGKLVAQRAVEKGITKVVFDRNGFLYHGRVKALSDGAREGGLLF